MQMPLHTSSSAETYIRNHEWRAAQLGGCPLHPSGGCSFARHGSYSRLTPRGMRIARWYCPQGHRTFSLLPDFLAARLPDLLDTIEDGVAAAGSARSMEAAAHLLRVRHHPRSASGGCAVAFAPSARGSTPSPISCRIRRLAALTRASPVCWPSFAAPWRQRFWPTFRHRSVFRRHGVPSEPTMATNTRWGRTGPRTPVTIGALHGRCLMQRHSPKTAAAAPTPNDMLRVWRADRCVQNSSAALYLNWIRRFRTYSATHGLDERTELTRDGASRFIAWYAQHRRLDPQGLGLARTALYALSRVYLVMGLCPPACGPPTLPHRPHRRFCRSMPSTSPVIGAILRRPLIRSWPMSASSRSSRRPRQDLEHDGADGHRRFLVRCAQRYARATVADIACSVRSFVRFLLATARISSDLAESVIAPVQPRFERPRPALPWEDVRRLLQAVDTSTARGLRDHALLLMMSTYGFGRGEGDPPAVR